MGDLIFRRTISGDEVKPYTQAESYLAMPHPSLTGYYLHALKQKSATAFLDDVSLRDLRMRADLEKNIAAELERRGMVVTGGNGSLSTIYPPTNMHLWVLDISNPRYEEIGTYTFHSPLRKAKTIPHLRRIPEAQAKIRVHSVVEGADISQITQLLTERGFTL